jgi:CheY-like chemotaxis protein
MEAALEMLGVHAVKAQSGKEGLSCLLQQDFAIVVPDLSMSMIDGFDTLRLMKERERSRTTPVILATASYNLSAIEGKAYALGAIDVQGKPIKREVLRRMNEEASDAISVSRNGSIHRVSGVGRFSHHSEHGDSRAPVASDRAAIRGAYRTPRLRRACAGGRAFISTAGRAGGGAGELALRDSRD